MKDKFLRAWPLWATIAAQAVLTLRWLSRTAPFTDEALYLDTGRQEWAHWLHHVVIPNYPAYFSGAPVFYPPLGAAAEAAGGLAGARGLSMVLMLASTVGVYFTGERLFGRQAAFFGSALFAVSGLVIHYGAFATYDALAVFFLVLGTWSATYIRDGKYRWFALCAAALALANAAKYATLAWDPVVIGVAVLHGWGQGGVRALARGACLVAALVALDCGLLALAGPSYVEGLSVTTVFRTIHWGTSSSPASVLWRAFALTGILVVLAFVGVAVSLWQRASWPVTLMLTGLALAALVAPIDQAKIHQLPSLDKNLGFGLSFAALAAGYAISACISLAGRRFPAGAAVGGVAGAALILLVLIAGKEQSVQFRGPSMTVAARLVTAIRHGYRPHTYIASDGTTRTEQYYLPAIPVQRWVRIGESGPAQLAQFQNQVCAGRISLVILQLAGRSYEHPRDSQVRAMLQRTQRYRLVTTAGLGRYSTQVWQLQPATGAGSCG